jgi:hypothetical protein
MENSGEGFDEFKRNFVENAMLSPVWVNGVKVNSKSAEQLSIKLRERYMAWQDGGLDLKDFTGRFRDNELRPLVGGDMLVINAATGAGKTSFANNLALYYNEKPIPWFSLELSDTRMHERNLIVSNRISGAEVERRILAGMHLDTHRFDHIYIDDNAMASVEYIDKQLSLFPLLTGEHPRMVVVDYIQLMPANHPAMGTVQKIEHNAVGLKVLAKKHNVIMVVLSQIGRKDEANLGASKGSGAIEESATMLIGLNNIDDEDNLKRLGIYKNSNGESDINTQIGWEGRLFLFDCAAHAEPIQESLDGIDPDDYGERECPF